jgi:gluconate 2-dehydrogenase alpha chain
VPGGLVRGALERGPDRDVTSDFEYPRVADELTYGIRHKLFQDLSKETITIRHRPDGRALPYRQLGSFLLGDGVGGAGVHWNGQHWRADPEELRLRSRVIERYGKEFIPDGMNLQDYPVSYAELEPHFDHFERVCGTSGRAGNLNGVPHAGGNPFEGARSRDYPLPPLHDVYGASLFAKAAQSLGYHPFPEPASNASGPYTNPYGAQLGPCNYCGYCERFGCSVFAKASPQTTILPSLRLKANFELRARSHVLRVNLDPSGERATGVTYRTSDGTEVEQPAQLVFLCAYQLHNVRLMLLSGIGTPYSPLTGEGVVGKNYAYQMMGNVDIFFDKSKRMNPFIGTGAGGQVVDDFNADHFDHGPTGFIGGAYIGLVHTGGRPIQQMVLPAGAPSWGSGWKAAIKENYLYSTSISTHGSVMSYADNCLDLDPTYKDSFGLPLLRMTFDWKSNEFNMTAFVTGKAQSIANAMGGTSVNVKIRKPGDHYDTRAYQTTHNAGGTCMGDNPKTSVLNRYLQSWSVHNVFAMGAGAFPQSIGYNPTGLVGALAYWSANNIKEHYLTNPGPMVPS